ncbi:hypothetical protein B7494_g7738 [Chlorociboria aeruginascens]|nr:hypothetical protein B7494_g7738 [Chlorociboria aeruginascens]
MSPLEIWISPRRPSHAADAGPDAGAPNIEIDKLATLRDCVVKDVHDGEQGREQGAAGSGQRSSRRFQAKDLGQDMIGRDGGTGQKGKNGAW